MSERLRFWDKDWNIIGVVPDFHQRSFHHGIEPLIFVPTYSPGNLLSLKINSNNISQTLDQVHAIYLRLFPGNTFEYNFLDDAFAKLYLSEIRFGNILSFFTILTILIASLGLFGLASYTTVLRKKEVGVRKVLGANSFQVVTLLNIEFIRLILVAILIAVPIAWYVIQIWLENFALKIEIEWWVFALAALIALSIALVTISFHSIKAALANPVDSLRDE
jgi:putative ABC transport system permease protein